MGVEKSKKAEIHSSQLNIPVAEGKRKGESVSPALSLQDVFSDPVNPEGRHTKTSSLFANEQGNEAQLGNKRGELFGFS